ncbi:hypothetical protein BC939DRAFT_505832 [Gamsiella multidivaricata]|uniref:uncharacterized protein n=1 Tax=Gamsiella multidivaricata TaxID=101098 RepID=UPI00221EAA0A|nr:uncharacterized protein BC939DRAFT_505832 [Gamsiella multidivaricata]KAI7819319.1 hypothetical protein BC939DRAFT_505832 [Gamsiella multidivaricata]
MSTKACAAKGRRECVRGFYRNTCHSCATGSIVCGMCSPSSASCSFCVDGRRECDDCYGLGFVQRICQDCIKEHYRRQGPQAKMTKAMGQVSKSMVSLTSVIQTSPKIGPSYDSRDESDSDVSSGLSAHSLSSSLKPRLQAAALKLSRATSMFSGSTAHKDMTHHRKWSWSSFSRTQSTPMAA